MKKLLARVVLEIIRYPALLMWYVIFGWRAEGNIPSDVDKMIITAVPHTSNWDYLHTLMIALYFRRKPYVTMKHSAFQGPWGWIFRQLGGVPVDRTRSTNMVDQIADWINNTERMVMIFTPEGTRRYTDYWKTGFYYTAVKANVPIICAYVDYKRKRGGGGGLFYPTGDIVADFEKIRAFYADHGAPLYPEKHSALRLKEEHEQQKEPVTAA